MIVDSLANAEKYYAIHPLFQKAFEFLKSSPLSTMENGTTVLVENDLKAIVQTPDGHAPCDAKLEYHRAFIDIQYVISGDETMGWSPLEGLGHPGEFHEKDDYGIAADKPMAWIPVRPGSFAVFFPEDAHAPNIGPSKIKKVVIKVRV